MTPLTMYCQKVATSIMLMPLSSADMIKAPMTAPATLPMPPARLVPPITQAAMASSSAMLPAEGEPAPRRELRINPAIATIRPLMANTASLVRSTLIPDKRAASRLPPMA